MRCGLEVGFNVFGTIEASVDAGSAAVPVTVEAALRPSRQQVSGSGRGDLISLGTQSSSDESLASAQRLEETGVSQGMR